MCRYMPSLAVASLYVGQFALLINISKFTMRTPYTDICASVFNISAWLHKK